jgi:hypothetical protein
MSVAVSRISSCAYCLCVVRHDGALLVGVFFPFVSLAFSLSFSLSLLSGTGLVGMNIRSENARPNWELCQRVLVMKVGLESCLTRPFLPKRAAWCFVSSAPSIVSHSSTSFAFFFFFSPAESAPLCVLERRATIFVFPPPGVCRVVSAVSAWVLSKEKTCFVSVPVRPAAPAQKHSLVSRRFLRSCQPYQAILRA